MRSSSFNDSTHLWEGNMRAWRSGHIRWRDESAVGSDNRDRAANVSEHYEPVLGIWNSVRSVLREKNCNILTIHKPRTHHRRRFYHLIGDLALVFLPESLCRSCRAPDLHVSVAISQSSSGRLDTVAAAGDRLDGCSVERRSCHILGTGHFIRWRSLRLVKRSNHRPLRLLWKPVDLICRSADPRTVDNKGKPSVPSRVSSFSGNGHSIRSDRKRRRRRSIFLSTSYRSTSNLCRISRHYMQQYDYCHWFSSRLLEHCLSGALMNKVGYYVLWYFAGGVLSLIGGALLHTAKVDTSAGAIYGYSVLVGLGCGLYVQLGYPVAQLKVDPASIPRVVAFIGCGQITGITLALVMSNSIFFNEATGKVETILPSLQRGVVQQAITGTGGTFFQTLGPSDRKPVLEAIVQSIGNVYGMVIAAGALSVVLSLFMKRERLNAAPPASATTEKGSTVEMGDDVSTVPAVERVYMR